MGKRKMTLARFQKCLTFWDKDKNVFIFGFCTELPQTQSSHHFHFFLLENVKNVFKTSSKRAVCVSSFQDRIEIILNTWIELGYVPSPAEVSKQEGIDFPWTKGEVSHINLS